MSWPIYAMDTHFMPAGLDAYALSTRCRMMADIGYDGTYFTLWGTDARGDLLRLADAVSGSGIRLAGVYGAWDMSKPLDEGLNAVIAEAFAVAPRCDSFDIALHFGGDSRHPRSDPAGDGAAVDQLHALLELARRHDRRIALYPHFSYWMERIEDAMRLARLINDPRVGVAFTSVHWHSVDGLNLRRRLTDAAAHLLAVNICGSRPNGSKDGLRVTIEPVGEGSLDHFFLLSVLRQIGYRGWIGVQGYGIGGDVYDVMARSYGAMRDLCDRASEKSDWIEANSEINPKW